MATQISERPRPDLLGPKGIEKTSDLPPKATFTGEFLARVQRELNANPQFTSEKVLQFLQSKGKEFSTNGFPVTPDRTMQLAILTLTFLNQFHLAKQKSGWETTKLEDIKTVHIFQDTVNKTKFGPGRGVQGALWYRIDWAKAPEAKPPRIPNRPTQERTPVSVNRAEQRRREYERLEQERREKEEVERSIFDVGREAGEHAIRNNLAKIEVIDGAAKVYIKEYSFEGEFHEVNMHDGTYVGLWKEKYIIGAELLRYLSVAARRAEGKEASYSPAPLKPAQCERLYQLAIKHRKITPMKDPDGNTVFLYEDRGGMADLYFVAYHKGNVDLESGTVITKEQPLECRPLHPDFVDFLKKKKGELDALQIREI